MYPASFDNQNILSVAATQGLSLRLAYFSNFGALTVDLAAPGHNIESSFNPLYNTQPRRFYRKLSGTSMAAPHVTGAVALLYSAFPKLSWQQVIDVLLSTTIDSKYLKGKVMTGGSLDIEAALKKASKLF